MNVKYEFVEVLLNARTICEMGEHKRSISNVRCMTGISLNRCAT